MFSIIVVPAHAADPGSQVRLAPGESLRFGRSSATAPCPDLSAPNLSAPNLSAPDLSTPDLSTPDFPSPDFSTPGIPSLGIPHPGISRSAGEIRATGSYWALSNFSTASTYVVENPEGAGEHIKIAPGRVDAPVPFEFSRVVLPAGNDLVDFGVWAPRHDYVERAHAAQDGEPTALAFPLDRSKRYFLVLAALCEPRLRGEPHAPLPTADRIVDRLRPLWPAVNRASVQWNIDYLAVKVRLKPGPDSADTGPRLNGKKEALVSLALRFDLVREEDLATLATAR
ncbi:FHA domain-containing protein [Streptomyces sp. NBC_00094]|uniref:FHA domain-containing protein n=1 Tax=Streptomyces sp. NBC_00094 TaxID=2903620 RepID=UPI00224EF859|nr:FHA domain-containing protein [Streptomyces sp. NBC_00094]MCX5392687.1 FHA domain-containing protein [Streptomyces sp. NBC_00094]